MAIGNIGATQRRVHLRKSITLAAEAALRESDTFIGRVLDVSEGGVFFLPEAGIDAGWLFVPGDGHSPEVDDSVSIYVTFYPNREPVSFVGRLAWSGRSQVHGAQGYGIALSPHGDQDERLEFRRTARQMRETFRGQRR